MEGNVILFGFKGCGKTHFGKLLAKAVRYDFVDTDRLIEALHGSGTCREILKEVGEASFRMLECQAIASLPDSSCKIISVGGGAVLDPQNYRRLQKLGVLVYLEAEKNILRKRVAATGVPAFFEGGDFERSFEKMYHERKPVYERLAQVKIETDEKNDEEVVAELLALI